MLRDGAAGGGGLAGGASLAWRRAFSALYIRRVMRVGRTETMTELCREFCAAQMSERHALSDVHRLLFGMGMVDSQLM